MLKTTFIMLGIFLSSFTPATRLNLQVSGRVTDAADGLALPGVNVMIRGGSVAAQTDEKGFYQLRVPSGESVLVFSFVGYESQEIKVGRRTRIDVQLAADVHGLSEVVVTGYGGARKVKEARATDQLYAPATAFEFQQPAYNTEEYDGINDNIFHSAKRVPLSTFSIDVDRASYANVRRFINQGQVPPKDAVRIEELINYFDYEYAQPQGEHPCRLFTEIAPAPWNPKHHLIHIGLQARTIPTDNLPPSNLVFLIDVSGSMNESNKLPLLKSSLMMLVDQLRPQDHVSIVVYAGAAGVVLKPTSGDEKAAIKDALNRLQAGGSTAGGAGIRLAYETAKEHYLSEGNNRVILATDGDFNVGESSNAAMERLIEEKRKEGVFLTVLGYGMGNYKDSKMETLADKGNGNYAYIDNITEARKVLVNEFGGTLFTLAKDVKLQVEFNPANVQAYRLIGYENRLLKDEDFNNDQKDAGEMGSGHAVTALYEVIPTGVKSEFAQVDELRYQQNPANSPASRTGEWMNIKLRYKHPDAGESRLIVHPVAGQVKNLNSTSANFRWSASVAAFGMLLRQSEYVKDFSYDDVVVLAEGAKGRDREGYRAEFVNMVRSLGLLASR